MQASPGWAAHRSGSTGVGEADRQAKGIGQVWNGAQIDFPWRGGIGAGINEVGMIPRFPDLVDLDFFRVALTYNLLDQGSLEEELPRCEVKFMIEVRKTIFQPC